MVVQKLSRWTLSDWTPLKVLKVQWEPSSFTYGVLPGELDADSIPSSGILNHWMCWANCEPLVVPVLFFFMVCETGISADHLQRNENFFLFWRFAFRNGNCYLNLNRINWDSRKGEYSFDVADNNNNNDNFIGTQLKIKLDEQEWLKIKRAHGCPK